MSLSIDEPTIAHPRVGRLSSQASWLAAGRVIAAGESAVLFVVLARSLPLDEFGSLALLLSIGMMMSIVTDLGLTGLLGNLVPAQPKYARPGARIVIQKRLILSCVAATLTGAAYLVAGGDGGWKVPALFALSIFASAVYSTFTTVFRASGHAGYDGANEALSRLVVLLLGSAVVIAVDGGLLAIVAVYAVVDLLSMVVLGVVFLFTTEPAGSVAGSPPLGLRAGRSLAVAGIVGTLYFRVDSWLLAVINGTRVVGRYAAAYRCFEALLLPALAVTSLSIPHTAGLEGRQLRDRLMSLAGFSVLLTTPFALCAFLGAEPVVRLIFGAEYASAATALKILSVGALITAATSAFVPPLALRSSRVALALAVNLALNVIANLLVIPVHGATGAAAVTVVCEVALLGWIALQIRDLGSARTGYQSP